MKKKYLVFSVVIFALVVLLTACSSPTPAPTQVPQVIPTQKPCPTAVPPAPAPTCAPAPEPVVKDVPFQDLWANSGHADTKAMAFNDWNDADPKEIPTTCAKCHSTPGYLDFLGADGSPAGVVDKAAPIGTVIMCVTCHNTTTEALTSVTFPSGVEVTGLGPEARCMVCHQGRQSKVSVDKAITDLALADMDTPSDKLTFKNVHYFAAGATLYGSVAKGGYEYDGQSYDVKFQHVEGLDTCLGCHDSHSLAVKVDTCKVCHTKVSTQADLKNIRMAGSEKDYDGDGDITEGIAGEIEGLQGLLLQAIQTYGKEVTKVAIGYNPDANPYFFIDTNGDGKIDETEAVSTNKYVAWTGRLLKASYNFQFSIKDPGAFAHNSKYVIELLFDSITDLNAKNTTKIDLSKANRIDAGHFAGSEMAFRDWDADGAVPAGCSKCHAANGMAQFLKEGVNISNPLGNGLACSDCHDDVSTFTRRQVTDGKVTFPSGLIVSFGAENDANLCIECHQGRQSTVSVNTAVGTSKPDDVTKLRFLNVHYFAAGATLFGTEAKGAYEYTGKTYVGRNMHVQGFDTCINCHETHTQEVQIDKCVTCHPTVKTVEDLATIRMSKVDYNGNGDVTEGISAEIKTFQDKLLAAIYVYAKEKAGVAILYVPSTNPYFFIDTNGDGQAGDDELTSANRYATFTPRLLEAAYNLHYSIKDPGGFAHNSKYILQVLYDSLLDIGGTAAVQGLTRPE